MLVNLNIMINAFTETTSINKNIESKSTNSISDKTQLRFEPFASCLDPNFWFKVAQLKLEIDKLDEVYRPLIGYYSSKKSPYVSLDCSSFNQ